MDEIVVCPVQIALPNGGWLLQSGSGVVRRNLKVLFTVITAAVILALTVPPLLVCVERDELTVYELISLAVSILKCGGVAFYIMLIAKTFRRDVENVDLEARRRLIDRQLDVDRLGVDHLEMRPYFYSGKTVTVGDEHYALVTAFRRDVDGHLMTPRFKRGVSRPEPVHPSSTMRQQHRTPSAAHSIVADGGNVTNRYLACQGFPHSFPNAGVH